MLSLFRAEHPLIFSAGLRVLAAKAVPVMIRYLETGLVPRVPKAVLCTSLMLAAFLCVASGMVLDTVTRGRREMKLLVYLSHNAVGENLQKEQF